MGRTGVHEHEIEVLVVLIQFVQLLLISLDQDLRSEEAGFKGGVKVQALLHH